MVELWTKAWEEEQRRINSLWEEKNENMMTAVMDRPFFFFFALQMLVVHRWEYEWRLFGLPGHGLKRKDGDERNLTNPRVGRDDDCAHY